MEQAGIRCHVLPANKVAKKRTDRIKTDKRDARLIGRELRSKSIRPIVVPDEADEAARDLLRCQEDAGEDLRRMKQRLLIEGAWHYTKNTRPGKRLEQRRQGSPADVVDTADRALHRLHKKYKRLVFKGKHVNTAVTAVARELAGFIWAVQVSAAA